MVITGLTAAGPHLGREARRHRSRNLNRSAFNKPRLTESPDPILAGMEMVVKQKDWAQAAIAANNLSELELGAMSGPVGGRRADRNLRRS